MGEGVALEDDFGGQVNGLAGGGQLRERTGRDQLQLGFPNRRAEVVAQGVHGQRTDGRRRARHLSACRRLGSLSLREQHIENFRRFLGGIEHDRDDMLAIGDDRLARTTAAESVAADA